MLMQTVFGPETRTRKAGKLFTGGERDAMTDFIAANPEAGDEIPDTGVVRKVDIEQVNAKTIRKSLRLTQERMALMPGTSVSGHREWEQGQRQPGGAALTLLRIMEKEPEAVMRALAS